MKQSYLPQILLQANSCIQRIISFLSEYFSFSPPKIHLSRVFPLLLPLLHWSNYYINPNPFLQSYSLWTSMYTHTTKLNFPPAHQLFFSLVFRPQIYKERRNRFPLQHQPPLYETTETSSSRDSTRRTQHEQVRLPTHSQMFVWTSLEKIPATYRRHKSYRASKTTLTVYCLNFWPPESVKIINKCFTLLK